MKSTMTLQVPTDTLLKLIGQLRARGGSHDLSEAITSAIELWLIEQSKLAPGSDPASVRGYQWKSLFLPEGTVLRSWSYGENNYARVEGDRIIHDGKPVSPNEFAQSFARTTRNAWTDLYIRRPEYAAAARPESGGRLEPPGAPQIPLPAGRRRFRLSEKTGANIAPAVSLADRRINSFDESPHHSTHWQSHD